MQAAIAPESPVTELMTWEEIRARFGDHWVCLVDVEWGRRNAFDIRRGRVVGHASSRREIEAQARDVRIGRPDPRCYGTRELEVVVLNPRWHR
ncbi:MAG TPA: hypothetical protein VHE35_11740 [Kofleriaceae bacterium]|nr:hypothetical protein [Kofleriaceae bacterium]